jgi:hypothetical protein
MTVSGSLARMQWGLGMFITLFFLYGMILSPSAICQRAGYEQPPVLSTSSLLPPDMQAGSSYKVKGDVNVEGMLYSFDLWSRYGWYHPRSLDMLRIRLAETRALDTLTAMQQDPLFLEGVGDQVKGTAESTVNAVKHPIKTIVDIPLGLHKFGKQMQAKAQEGNTLPEEDIRGIHEGAKRQLAVSLGVDPYTDNKPLQDALNYVATNKNRGALATRVGTAFIPAVGPALGAAQLNKGLQGRLANMTASELQQETRRNLTQLGVPKADVDLFMRNPGYTPTNRAAISDAMSGLAGVAGMQNYIQIIQEVPAPEAALFFQRRIQLAERFHRSVRPLDKMVLVGVTPVFSDRNGGKVFTIAVDYVYWNEELARKVENVRRKLGKGACDLYITGVASQLAKDQLAANGISLHEKWGNN